MNSRIDVRDEGGVTVANVSEEAALCASPIACAVGDSWAAVENMHSFDTVDLHQTCPTLCAALDALELATRESQLRKVRP